MSGSPESITSLEGEFQDIQIRAFDDWSFVFALRECFTVTEPLLEDALIPYLDNSIRTAMGDAFPKVSERVHLQTLKFSAGKKQQFARSLLDAATIVVVQAILDSAVNEYLLVLARGDMALWEGDVRDDRIALIDLKDREYEDVLRERAIAFAKSLAAKSLSKKIQLILDRCYRHDITLSPAGFRFDVQRIKEFDDVRHDVAHGRGMGVMISNMDDVLLFLWQTLLSLQDVVGAHLGWQPGSLDQQVKNSVAIKIRNLTL